MHFNNKDLKLQTGRQRSAIQENLIRIYASKTFLNLLHPKDLEALLQNYSTPHI